MCLFIYTHFGCLSLELNRVPGVLLEPYMSQGGSGERRAPHGIERVNLNHFFRIQFTDSSCEKQLCQHLIWHPTSTALHSTEHILVELNGADCPDRYGQQWFVVLQCQLNESVMCACFVSLFAQSAPSKSTQKYDFFAMNSEAWFNTGCKWKVSRR